MRGSAVHKNHNHTLYITELSPINHFFIMIAYLGMGLKWNLVHGTWYRCYWALYRSKSLQFTFWKRKIYCTRRLLCIVQNVCSLPSENVDLLHSSALYRSKNVCSLPSENVDLLHSSFALYHSKHVCSLPSENVDILHSSFALYRSKHVCSLPSENVRFIALVSFVSFKTSAFYLLKAQIYCTPIVETYIYVHFTARKRTRKLTRENNTHWTHSKGTIVSRRSSGSHVYLIRLYFLMARKWYSLYHTHVVWC